MAIIRMTSELRDEQFNPTGQWPEGAYCDLGWSRQRGWIGGQEGDFTGSGGIVLVESHRGLVLELGERNGYDDSDFYATVWTGEGVQRIEYASTRGWCYPNTASVDATPEVRAAYNAWVEERARRQRIELDALRAACPSVGDTVEVKGARGKGAVANGRRGEVRWVGLEFRSEYRHRLGVKLPGEAKPVFVSASCCRKVLDTGELAPKDAQEALTAMRAWRTVSAYA